MNLTAPPTFTYAKSVGRPKVKAEAISIRLTRETLELCTAITAATGRDRTAIIETAVTEYAASQGITAPVRLASGADVIAETKPPYTAE